MWASIPGSAVTFCCLPTTIGNNCNESCDFYASKTPIEGMRTEIEEDKRSIKDNNQSPSAANLAFAAVM